MTPGSEGSVDWVLIGNTARTDPRVESWQRPPDRVSR